MANRVVFWAAVVVAACGVRAWGDEAATGPATQPKTMAARSDTVVTTGILHSAPSGAGGGAVQAEMKYTATTGYMPLKDEHEKLRANIFYVAYTAGTSATSGTGAGGVEAAATQVSGTQSSGSLAATMPDLRGRPVTFVFNGGPGAAAVWLHLGAVGPKRLDVPEDGRAPAPPYRVVDNEYSWLPATDLVLVDPVGTGYSRAATPEIAKEFFGVQEDVSAMGEFIRLYMTKYQRWGSPVFLAGESYGTTRAAALSLHLQERVGVNVSGVVLISTVLNFATLAPEEGNDVPFALYLPSYAAVAWYHKKVDMGRYQTLDALLKEAEDYARNDYMVALGKGAAMTAGEKAAVAKRLAELTGLKSEYIAASDLRVPPRRFEKELLRDGGVDGGKVIGRFDGRITGSPLDAENDGAEYDPSLSAFYPAYTSAFNDYVRRTLKYENDLTYEVLKGSVGPWNFGAAGNGYLYVGDNLRDAMTQNPKMKLLVCSGRFDLATPYFATDYTLSHMTMAADIRKNIRQEYFPAGHMVYHVRPALEKLCRDVTGFIGVASN